jgi:alpha-tubulin suppressor-like RCC1 family protein
VLLPDGRGSAFAVTDGGDLYVTGFNSDGALGLGHSNHVSVWTKVGADLAGNVRRVTGGPSSGTFLVTRSGDLFVTGKNAQGQLGLGNTVALNSWTKIETEGLAGKAICAKAVPGASSQSIGAIVLTSSNGLFVAGKNANGELGLGSNAPQLSWTEVATPGLAGKVAVPSGNDEFPAAPIHCSPQLFLWNRRISGVSSVLSILVFLPFLTTNPLRRNYIFVL